MKEKLKRSVQVIILLVLLIIADHIIMLLGVKDLPSMLLDFTVLVVAIVYFIQLQENLHYAGIRNILFPVVAICTGFAIGYFSIETMQVTQLYLKPFLPVNAAMQRILSVFGLLMALLGLLASLVSYILLGNRLARNGIYHDIRWLGIAFCLFTIHMAGLFILPFFQLQLYSHLLIIFELLPYGITLRIYRRMLQEDAEGAAPAESTMRS